MDKEQVTKILEKIKKIVGENNYKLALAITGHRTGKIRDVTMASKDGELLLEYVEQLEQQCKKQKEVIDKAIKCIDYNTKYRNGADIYQFVDIESEILEPLKFILELDEENGNAYLKEFNDWLKEVE